MTSHAPARIREMRFLREYATFSCRQPVAVAEALFHSLLKAYAEQDFDRVAYLLLALHSELVRSCEAAGALLRALSPCNEYGGIIEGMLRYKPRQVPEFVDDLAKAPDWMSFLGLPSAEAISEAFHIDAGAESYTEKGVHEVLDDFVRIYQGEGVKEVHNKLKHGVMIIRHPDLLSDKAEDSRVINGDRVCLILNDRCASFPVSNPKTVEMARGYMAHIQRVSEICAFFAQFAADCLDSGLSVGSCRPIGATVSIGPPPSSLLGEE